ARLYRMNGGGSGWFGGGGSSSSYTGGGTYSGNYNEGSYGYGNYGNDMPWNGGKSGGKGEGKSSGKAMCKFWMKGECTRGASCTWSHGDGESKDWTSGKGSKFFSQGNYEDVAWHLLACTACSVTM
ncbi:unnamed protein product, partial [Durusdinium trenchii]